MQRGRGEKKRGETLIEREEKGKTEWIKHKKEINDVRAGVRYHL